MFDFIDIVGKAFIGQARQEARGEMGHDESVDLTAPVRLRLVPRAELESDRAQAA